jgi:hypothetical protein
MKMSNLNLDQLIGVRKRARRKKSRSQYVEQYFRKPILHREIQGDRIYVPLNLERVWNEI